MSLRGRAGVLACVIGASACGSSSPPSSPNPGGGGERISGNERLGWNQAASGAAELATFRFAAYVDGNRTLLAEVNCGASGDAFQCSSRMPSMSPGAHTIELVSFVDNDGSVVESGRSSPLRVTLSGAIAPAAPNTNARSATEHTTADGIRLSLTVVADGVDAPTALAFSPDGRVIVAERSGRVRIVEATAVAAAGQLDPIEPALQLDDVLVPNSLAGGLIDIALDPDFVRTGLIYLLYTTSAADGSPVFKVARFRDGRHRHRS
jgi:hypothetical protein